MGGALFFPFHLYMIRTALSQCIYIMFHLANYAVFLQVRNQGHTHTYADTLTLLQAN